MTAQADPGSALTASALAALLRFVVPLACVNFIKVRPLSPPHPPPFVD